MLLGFMHWFETHVPSVGFFQPIGGAAYPNSNMDVDRHVELVGPRTCMNEPMALHMREL